MYALISPAAHPRFRFLLPPALHACLILMGAAFGLAALPLPASAQDIWNSTGTATWTTTADWSAGSVPGASDSVTINSGTADVNGGSYTIGALTGSGTIIDGSGSVASLTIGNGATGTSTFSGSLNDGSGGLSLGKVGSGTQILAGSDAFSQVIVYAGTLEFANSAAILDSFSATQTFVEVDSGATLAFAVGGSGLGASDVATALGQDILAGGSNIAFDTTNAGGSFTYGNGIADGSGSLGVVKLGTGTLVLSSANTYTGGTTISAGTLQLSGSGTLGSTSGILNVNSGATLDLNGTNQTVGLFYGSGTITSSTSGGILTIDNGDTGVGTYTYSGTLQDGTGSTGLTKNGTSTEILTGSNTYSLGTVVNAGTLEVDNTTGSGTGSGSTNVYSGGTLRGTGTAGGDVQIASGGTLSAGTASSIGAFAIGGNLYSGSTTTMRIYGTTAGVTYDQINVTGVANLGGTLSLSYGSFVPQAGQTFNLITATGGISGTFTTIVNPLANALTFTYNSHDGTLVDPSITVTTVQNSYVPFATNPNQASAGRMLDSVASDPRAATLISYLNALPGTSLAAAMSALTPIGNAVVPPLVTEDAHATFRTLNQRMGAIRAGSTGLDISQVHLDNPEIPIEDLIASNGDTPVSSARLFRPTIDNRWGFFAAADGNFGSFDGGTGGQNSSYSGEGMDAGGDYRISRNLVVGFATGYNHDKQDFDDAGSSVTVNTVRFGPYATWKDQKGDWVDGTIGGAYHWFDSDRVALGGNATGSTTGLEFDTSTTYGHDFILGSAKQWTLTPTVGLDYVHLTVDRYAESGSIAPMIIEGQTNDSLRSSLGGTVAYATKVCGLALSPYLQAGWDHEFLDAVQAVNSRLASGAGSDFTVYGASSGHEIATFGLGVNAALTERISANLGYAGEANESFQDHSLRASLRVTF